MTYRSYSSTPLPVAIDHPTGGMLLEMTDPATGRVSWTTVAQLAAALGAINGGGSGIPSPTPTPSGTVALVLSSAGQGNATLPATGGWMGSGTGLFDVRARLNLASLPPAGSDARIVSSAFSPSASAGFVLAIRDNGHPLFIWTGSGGGFFALDCTAPIAITPNRDFYLRVEASIGVTTGDLRPGDVRFSIGPAEAFYAPLGDLCVAATYEGIAATTFPLLIGPLSGQGFAPGALIKAVKILKDGAPVLDVDFTTATASAASFAAATGGSVTVNAPAAIAATSGTSSAPTPAPAPSSGTIAPDGTLSGLPSTIVAGQPLSAATYGQSTLFFVTYQVAGAVEEGLRWQGGRMPSNLGLLIPQTAGTYTVRGYDAATAGNKVYESAQFTVTAAPGALPATPTQAADTGATSSGVTMNWSATGTSYRVLTRPGVGSVYGSLADATVSTNSYTFTGLAPSSSPRAIVISHNASGFGTPSGQFVSFTTA